MPPQKSGRGRSVTHDVLTILWEDRRLVVGALIFAVAAIVTYALVRHFRVVG